jgi:hypothetical protein
MATHTKAELAAILGCAQANLLSREAVAVILDRSEGTLRTKKDDYPGFYKLSDQNKGEVLYPKPWVLAYRKWLDAGKPGQFKGKLGAQPWPEGKVQREISGTEALIMMDRWLYKNLHHRCERIFNGQNQFEDLDRQHQKEWRIVHDGGDYRNPDDPIAIKACLRIIPTIIQPVVIEPERLVPLVLTTWRRILDQERAWLKIMPR